MAMSIGGTTLPSSIENHGVGYRFYPPEVLHDDGEGNPVSEPYSHLEWTFDIMEPADYDWITITLLGGAPSAKYSSASLYNDNRVLTSYTGLTVRRPKHDGIANGWYRNVVWNMDYIV